MKLIVSCSSISKCRYFTFGVAYFLAVNEQDEWMNKNTSRWLFLFYDAPEGSLVKVPGGYQQPWVCTRIAEELPDFGPRGES